MGFYGNIFTRVKDAYIKVFKVKTDNDQKELVFKPTETVTENDTVILCEVSRQPISGTSGEKFECRNLPVQEADNINLTFTLSGTSTGGIDTEQAYVIFQFAVYDKNYNQLSIEEEQLSTGSYNRSYTMPNNASYVSVYLNQTDYFDGQVENLQIVKTISNGNLNLPFSVEMSFRGDSNNGILTDIVGNAVTIDATGLITNMEDKLNSLEQRVKAKQSPYTKTGTTAETITKVEQNDEGKVTVTYEKIAFPAQLSATVENGILKFTFQE